LSLHNQAIADNLVFYHSEYTPGVACRENQLGSFEVGCNKKQFYQDWVKEENNAGHLPGLGFSVQAHRIIENDGSTRETRSLVSEVYNFSKHSE
jgi:hypothetical protein